MTFKEAKKEKRAKLRERERFGNRLVDVHKKIPRNNWAIIEWMYNLSKSETGRKGEKENNAQCALL